MFKMYINEMSLEEMTQHRETLAPIDYKPPSFATKPPQYSIEPGTWYLANLRGSLAERLVAAGFPPLSKQI